jgi:hypothetical protein
VSANSERTINGSSHSATRNGFDERDHSVEVSLSEEQMAAVEGWRAANRIESRKKAVQELVRLGLLSEIARVYRMVAAARDDFDDRPGNGLDAHG